MKPRLSIPWLLLALTPVVLVGCLWFGPAGIGFPDWSTSEGRLLLQLRLPRVLAGFLVGAALSSAGTVFQAVLRNPLAEPYVLGISSGGGLGAALAILTGLAAASPFSLPLAAFAAALATLALVYRLAGGGGRGAPSLYGLILSGVIVSAIASSLLMFCISIAPLEGMHSILWWMLGNLQADSPVLLGAVAVLVAGAFAGLWLLAGSLNALALGTDMAHHLGVRTRLVLALGLGLATAMTAAAVSLAGLIGFIGLVVPHVVRTLTGADHRRLLPAAALGGGLFLPVCDAVARCALPHGQEIPVGVLTAFLGGPFFLFLLRRRRDPG